MYMQKLKLRVVIEHILKGEMVYCKIQGNDKFVKEECNIWNM
ncbi:hypothetical protein [Clostridium estertheticum]|nr:hypothetical protein [Clostridium estertheticum]